MIVTFYSFKGGVGRTLALANVGVVLAQNGYRVLVVDFDLEAPGLTRYLEKEFGGDLQRRRGLLELLERQRDAGNAADHLREYTVEIVHNAEGGVLELLTSGHQDKSYPQRVLDFDWSTFFMNDDGGNFFEHCRQEWAKKYDYVLIDSRTGITDSGGVCTIQLPDIIVPVFTASRQSVDGVIDVVRRAQEGRQLLAYDRPPAAIVPLPSKFDSRTEYTLSQRWLDEFAVQFKGFYESWLPKEIPVRQVLERTKLPYVAFFSFGERLPVLEESGSDPESLGYALRTFTKLLEGNLQDVSSLVTSSDGAADHGEAVTLTHLPRVFLSFARSDRATAERLRQDLRERDIEAFLLLSDGNWVLDIDRVLAQSDYFVLLWSQAVVDGPWVNAEWSVAFARELRERRSFLFIVQLDGTPLPAPLAARHYFDAFDNNWDGFIDELAAIWLRDRSVGKPVLPAPHSTTSENSADEHRNIVLYVRNRALSVTHVIVVPEESTGRQLKSLVHAALALPDVEEKFGGIMGMRFYYRLENARGPIPDDTRRLAELHILNGDTIDLETWVESFSPDGPSPLVTYRKGASTSLSPAATRSLINSAFGHLIPQ